MNAFVLLLTLSALALGGSIHMHYRLAECNLGHSKSMLFNFALMATASILAIYSFWKLRNVKDGVGK